MLASQQAVTGQVGESGQQAGDIDDQLRQAIDFAFEGTVLQRQRQLVAFDLVNATTHGLAGEETGQVAGNSAGRPQVMSVG
ncbi:hypothetical protein D3C81_1386220 [compost metagenome]